MAAAAATTFGEVTLNPANRWGSLRKLPVERVENYRIRTHVNAHVIINIKTIQ
jgi:hypothetical protein